ncbi:MAG TPA: N-acetylmuramoyl-L-alanine amidase [Actinomycetota bacterium]|nr:N-acetylmuramoyl-L-alanine amidase [Actinomycetota bacterium]
MKRLRPRVLLLAGVLATAVAAIPVPAPALSTPETLAASRRLGDARGRTAAVDPSFPVDFVGLSWRSGGEPEIRFRDGGAWGPWGHVHEDEIPSIGGRTFSSLIPAGDADAYQVRGPSRGVRAVAINTSDGPRALRWGFQAASASHLAQPAVVTRAGWGADESLRFDADGNEIWPPAFYETEKLIVHHTATANDDPDPAATVRAIYRYHAVDRGFGDIGYNFLIDAQGNVYKGRYSGPPGTWYEDTPTGENAEGLGVTGAHTGGWNSGTMGIAILGTFTDTAVPAAARSTLVDHLAWESERHAIDPLAVTTFTNPVSGDQKTTDNISGHRDWVATECPGGVLYDGLPQIRQDVAAKVSGEPAPDTQAPVISNVAAAEVTATSATITWSTDEPADSRVEYWAGRNSTHLWTTLDTNMVTAHSVQLSGLSRRTRYQYRVHSADAAGNAAASDVYSFRTTR